MIVLNCETVDLADLFSGEYWLHVGIIAEKEKAAMAASRLPAAAPTVRFSRIPNLYSQ